MEDLPLKYFLNLVYNIYELLYLLFYLSLQFFKDLFIYYFEVIDNAQKCNS
jgi:hypothetical protein